MLSIGSFTREESQHKEGGFHDENRDKAENRNSKAETESV